MSKTTLSERTASHQMGRRDVLKGGAALVGGLLVSFGIPLPARAAYAAADTRPFSPNGFVRVDRQGYVSLIIPSVEMGQGIYTGLAAVIAEELEVSFDKVSVEHAPPNQALYANILVHEQITGGSTSTRAWRDPLQRAGAVARNLLIQAAAGQWQVDVGECHADGGAVIHGATGRQLPYGDLVEAAAVLPVPDPQSVTLKDPKTFKLIGRALKRLDTPDKVNGKAVFGIDARPAGLLVAAIANSPVVGGTLKSCDDAAALAVKGVRQIVRIDGAVAVVADHTGAARKGMAALNVQWEDGPNAAVDIASLTRDLELASTKPGAVARSVGDFASAYAGAAQKIDVAYQTPFLAHAPMEPLNCTVHVRSDSCEVWIGTQAPPRVQGAAAALTGLPPEKVTVHNTYLGGSFGRKSEVDYVIPAVKIAQQVDAPVKVIWSREEDIQHCMFRPYYYDRMSAGLDSSGKPVAWQHRVTGSSILGRLVPPLLEQTGGVDPDAVEGAAQPLYDLPVIHVEYARHESPAVPTTWWRSVGVGHNVFMVESFIDELAAAARQDPVAYRRSLLGQEPRARAVLDLATEKAGWGRSLPERHGLGVAVQLAFGSYLAQVAEVVVGPDGSVSVPRVTVAVDCGQAINPNAIEAQIQGGLIYGLSAVLFGEITFRNGRVEQGNFNDYRAIRINDAPAIDVHIIESSQPSGGIGEAATAAIFPAVVNAIFAATGVRIRKLPVIRNGLV